MFLGTTVIVYGMFHFRYCSFMLLPINVKQSTVPTLKQLGESFGGVLALAVAAANPRLVDRVVLVNPATSFPRSPWPTIGPVLLATPPEAYGLLPYILAPLLANPLNMASRVVRLAPHWVMVPICQGETPPHYGWEPPLWYQQQPV